MKKLILVFGFLFFYGFFHQTSAYGGRVDFYYFYDRLDPYGDWIELNDGLVVWKPARASYFWAPYKYGSWLWTNAGWYWDSDEPFGYITYHYGRWHYDSYYGWIWVPDYDWAPAWVSWRYDDDYIGWAPLPPYAAFSMHSGITFSITFNLGYNHWNFVRYRNFCSPYVHRYYSVGFERRRLWNRTREHCDYRWENDRIFNRGVDRDRIRERSNVEIRERNIVFRENGSRGVEKNRDEIIINRGGETKERDRKEIRLVSGERATDLDGNRVNIGERKDRFQRDKVKVTKLDETTIKRDRFDDARSSDTDEGTRDWRKNRDDNGAGNTRNNVADENNERKDNSLNTIRETKEKRSRDLEERGKGETKEEKRKDVRDNSGDDAKGNTRENKYNNMRGTDADAGNNGERKSDRTNRWETKKETPRDDNSGNRGTRREERKATENNGNANRDPYPDFKKRTEDKPREEKRNEVREEKRNSQREERKSDRNANERGNGSRERDTKSRER